MTCKERILSEEYYDLITDYLFPTEYLDREQPDYCYVPIDDKFGVVYVQRTELPELSSAVYGYSLIPKLYGLMQDTFDPLPLINSGILRAQNAPLNLTGRRGGRKLTGKWY